MNCPSCKTPNPEYSRYCLDCGYAIESKEGLLCLRCGIFLPTGAKFCHVCGTAVGSSTSLLRADSIALPNSFTRFMPKECVDQLQASQSKITGERRVITILFADVKGSTAMAEQLDPEDVMEIMNEAFEVLIEPVCRYEGTLARLMGDAILAFFGAPISHEDDPERACRAALEIIEGARRFAERLQRESRVENFNVRVGINTGLVVVGEVGTRLRVEYTAMGDAVNLAARMESAAEPGTVLLTQDTFKRIANAFETEPIGPLHVKGKSEPVNTFRLLRARDVSSTTRRARESGSPFVGRDVELTRLQTALNALQQGNGGTIALIGEAGLGKTRLVAEAQQQIKGSSVSPHVWVEGHCLSYAEGMTYSAARSILRGFLGAPSEIASADLEEILQKNVKRFFPERSAEVYPFLARLLDVPLDAATEERIGHLSAEVWLQRMRQAFCDYVSNCAATQPVVLVWEDLHWIDASSLDLLKALLPITNKVPLLLILVFRPNEGHVWEWHQQQLQNKCEGYAVIALEPLSRDASSQLVDQLAGITSITPETHEVILKKAEGNPFFLEEVLRSLLDSGLSAQGSPTKSFIAKYFRVPDTLQGVIMARIDRLRSTDKLALQTASVIGRVFRCDILAQVIGNGLASEQLGQSLDELCRREFVILSSAHPQEIHAPFVEYAFKHSLTLEVAYNSLLIAQRKTLHQRVAEALEAQFPQRPELAATLAYHFEQAEIHAKAFDYLFQAACRAATTFANKEAIAFYRRALAQGELAFATPQALVPVLEGLGDVHALVGEYAAAMERYEQALHQADKNHQRAALFRKMGQICEKSGKRDQALVHFDAGLMELRESMDAVEAARIYTGMGLVHYRRGELDAALELSCSALALMEGAGDEWGIARACNNLGILYGTRSQWKDAMRYHDRALTIWERIGDAYGLAASHNNMGWVLYLQGIWNQAFEHYQQSLALCDKTGYKHGMAFAYDNLGQVYKKLGEDEKAMDCMIKAVEIVYALSESKIVPEMWELGAW